MLVNALFQQRAVADALTAANDLAIALRREQVGALAHLRPAWIRLHVKRLHRRREANHEHRLLIQLRQRGLVRAAKVHAPRDVEQRRIVDAFERPAIVAQHRLAGFQLRLHLL